MTYRFLDHTADVGADVEAATLGGLYAEALAAFTDTVTELRAVRPERERRVELSAVDLEDLMVDWLGELLYLFEVDELLFREAAVEVERADDGVGDGGGAAGDGHGGEGGRRLTATVRGEPYAPDRHPVKVLVKGITYHALQVAETPGGGWRCRVIFDI